MATAENPVPQSGAKRKASTAGIAGSTRPVKRRASKACHCCRSRKVRCDVVESGIPCTNCRLDEVECVVTEGKRRKKSYVDSDVLNHSPIESVEDKEEIQKFPLFEDIDGLQGFSLPGQETSGENGKFQTLKRHQPHLIYQNQAHRLSPGERSQHLPTSNQLPPLSTTPLPLPSQLQYHSPITTRPEILLPQYIAPIPRHMLGEDLEYLHKKGAFQLPDASLRNELLRSYVQYVHPYLPLIDVREFLSAIRGDDSREPVSLLLFHAVMFAASAYIDLRHLTMQGYSSRKMARKAYFQRVKLLYDFDWEVDRVTVVQSVLLMSYWYESPNDPKDVSYWLGVAISIAKTIGMNYNTEGTTILSLQKQRLWKRIWWCAYIRDRIIAIGLRRPFRIRKEDYNMPMLDPEDFDTEPLPPELCRMLGGCSAIRDGSKRETLAKMCISLAQICHLITDVLETQYTVLSHKIGITSETTVRLVQKPTGPDVSEVLRCDTELENWYSALSFELRYFKLESRDRTNNHDGEVICVHRALLTAIYLTASSALHRPQMMPTSPDLVIPTDLKELSQRRVHSAALDLTEAYRDLYVHDLIRYLPNTGVTVLLPAIIIHLLDIKSSEGEERQTSLRHFQFCMQALQKLRDLYSSADFAYAFLDAAVKKSEGRDRLQVTLADDNPASVSTPGKTTISWDVNEATLTPPPDMYDGANKCVDMSTLDRNKRGPYKAMTPPSPNQVSSLRSNSGISLSLKDLEAFIGLDDMQHDEQNLASLVPAALDNMGGTNLTGYYNASATTNATADPHSVQLHEFDSLVNLEASSELFAPNQVSIDDNLFKDIDMEWLADSNDDDDEEEDSTFDIARLIPVTGNVTGSKATAQDSLQMLTPPESSPASSIASASRGSVDRVVQNLDSVSPRLEKRNTDEDTAGKIQDFLSVTVEDVVSVDQDLNHDAGICVTA